MKNKLTTFLVTVVSVLLLGCYPQGPEFTEDLDIVLTNFEDEYEFSSRNTYAMPDKIVKITGNQIEGDEPKFIPDATATLILSQIDKNMAELGWDKVGVDENPDVLLTPAAMETTTIYYYYDYWYWWYGGYYPGWGYPSYSSYTTGTLIMGLIDPEIIGANGNAVIQWSGALNGILTNYYDASRVNKLIDQAFDQSPYLKTN